MARASSSDAGLEVEEVERFEKTHPTSSAWLARTGCAGDEAERVRELLADRMTDDGAAWTTRRSSSARGRRSS